MQKKALVSLVVLLLAPPAWASPEVPGYKRPHRGETIYRDGQQKLRDALKRKEFGERETMKLRNPVSSVCGSGPGPEYLVLPKNAKEFNMRLRRLELPREVIAGVKAEVRPPVTGFRSLLSYMFSRVTFAERRSMLRAESTILDRLNEPVNAARKELKRLRTTPQR